MQSDQADLRDFNTQMTKPAIADRRITGSANMKIGIFPDVNVTIVDDRTIRDMPDAMIIRPLCRICFIRAIIYAAKQTMALISGYMSSTLRDISPLAFP